MNKIRAWYGRLQAREQRILNVGGVVLLALLLLGGVLLPLQSAVSTAEHQRDTRRDDLDWMRRNAATVQSGGALVPLETGEPAVVLGDRVGREAGLGGALRGTQPSGNGVRVQLEAAPFDTLVAWLATLELRYGLGIE